MKVPPVILTIAGSDSGAGAGVQADARAIHALGGYACTAITAITAQNTRGVIAWRTEPAPLIAAQIAAVFADFTVAAIKTGLLPGAAAIRAIASTVPTRKKIPLVIDPIIGSTSGTRFLDARGLRALERELLPRATLVTPNWPEAEVLARRTIKTSAEAEDAATALVETYGCAVLVKGGHGSDRKLCCDVLVTPEGLVRWFSSPRIATRNTHGTGCTLSAAIATWLARGATLDTAVARAHAFLRKSLVANRQLRLGQGAGPAFPG